MPPTDDAPPLQPHQAIYSRISKLNSADIVRVLRLRFELERISRYFNVATFVFSSEGLQVTDDNSVMMEFPTLRTEYPDDYSSAAYRLLLLLDLRSETQFPLELQLEIKHLAGKHNIDQVIIWSCERVAPRVVHALKNISTDILYVRPDEVDRLKSISHFIPPTTHDYDYAMALNTIADLLLRRLKKLFHLVLSEIAAPIYNKLYGKTKVATAAMMQFEEELVRRVTNAIPRERRLLAIDVGCGTGRHTFPLASRFRDVHAFDFAPRMIEEANKQKKMTDVRNVMFSVADLEHEDIIDEGNFYAKAGLVVASFGMASFVEDTPHMLRRFHTWLAEDGYVILSFYNTESLVLQVTPNWRDTSLSAHLDSESNTLRVELASNAVFHIFCKPFSNVLLGAIKSVFEVEAVYTYPTVMALMPNSLLEHELAKRVFGYLDSVLASNEEFRLGHYVIVVARKIRADTVVTSEGAVRVRMLLDAAKVQYEVLSHIPVLSIEEAARELANVSGTLVKTVVFLDRRKEQDFVTIALPADKRVNKLTLANLIGVAKSKIKFATEKEVLQLGFPIGGVAPFGFKEGISVTSLVDAALDRTSDEWIYTGAGDNRKTLRIKAADFTRLTASHRRVTV